MIADGVRDVVALGEGRDGDEGNADSELIEVGALRRVGAGGIGGEGGAERDGVVQAGVGVAEEVGVALGPAAGLQAGGRVGEIGALAGRDAVGIALAGLRSMGRTDVVIETAVLIVGDEDDRILPVGAVADGIDDLGDVSLAALDVGGRMLVVFEGPAATSEVGIEEGDLRKRPRRSLGEKEFQRQEVWICRAEAAALGVILEVVGPGDVVFIEKIEDRPVDGFVTAGGRGDVTCREMAEGGGSEKIGAVGEGGSEDRREIAVIDGEFLGQIVVERDFVLGVEVHRLIFGRVFAPAGSICSVMSLMRTKPSARKFSSVLLG